MDFLLNGFLGVLIGFFSGFFGIGGGTILVPVLMLMGYTMKESVGISVLQMLLSSVFGSYVNYKAKKLDLKVGLACGIGGLIGAMFSGFVVAYVDEIYLKFALLFALFVAIVKFFFAPSEDSRAQIDNKFLLFSLGFVIGVFAISIGVGGALFLTPILVGFLHFDMKKAISIGLLFVFFASLSGFVSLAMHDMVDYQAGLIIGLGAIVGVYFGVKTGHKVDKTLQKCLLLALYVVLFAITLYKLKG